ncbi:MAG: hypothetical protein IPP19_07990 [Verrucomicrobia bacterium]|nr:hypothetical protein [Verrucomicrobiota bacterium]
MANEKANTVKFSTLMLLILGLFIPLWPISLPVCWYFAYKSYKRGEGIAGIDGDSGGGSSLDEIKKAKALYDAGAIDLGEYEKIKRRHLG